MADPFDPAAFGLTPAAPAVAASATAPAATAAPVAAASQSTPASDPYDPTAFGLTPAAPATSGGYRYVPPYMAPDGETTTIAPDQYDTFKAGKAGAAAAPPKQSGYVANAAAGVNSGIASALGAPVDLATGAINLVPRAINAVAGTSIPTIQNPIGGSQSIKQAMGIVGANPDDVEAASPGQRLVRDLGEGATMALAPEAAGAGLIRAGIAAAPAVMPVVEKLGAISAPNVAMGAASAVGSDNLARAAPDSLKPIAGVVGGVLGGMVPAGAAAGYQGARNALSSVADSAGMGTRNPLLDTSATPLPGASGNALVATGAQVQAAKQRLLDATSDPDAALAAISTPTVSTLPTVSAGPNAPNASLTTYQVTGDQGLGTIERGVSQSGNAPFITQKNQQNSARVGALDTIPEEGASASAPGASFTKQLADLDAQHQQAVNTAQQGVQQSISALGPVPTGDGASVNQQFGQQIRGRLDAANQTAKEREGQLWSAVDPDGTLAVDGAPIQAAAQGILKEHGQFATPLGADEANILHLAATAPDQMKFSDLKDFRSQITDAVSQARRAGDMQTARRLSQLLDGVHEAMEGGLTAKSASDDAAVAAGTITPEQTVQARLAEASKAWYADRQANAAAQANTAAIGRNAAPGSGGVSSMGGGQGPAGGGSGNAPGTSSLQGSPQLEPFDEAAQQRYSDARAATAERHATFTNAPGVGPVLAPGRWSGEFKMPDSSVPGAVFTSSSGAAERIQAYLKAGGSPNDLAGFAASDLRRTAENTDGTINGTKLQTWIKQRSEALSALPELRDKLSTVAGAQDALDQASAAQKQAVTGFQQSAAGKLMGDVDVTKRMASILGSDTAKAQMADLAAKTAGDAPARAGLQRVIIDHVLSQFRGDKLAGQTDTTALYGAQLQKFIRQKNDALSEIITPQQMQRLRDIADNMQRADQSVGGNILAGNSATTQNAAAMGRASTILSQIKQHFIGSVVGAPTGAILGSAVAGPLGTAIGGALGAAGGAVMSSLKAANIKTIDDLVREAVLNPEVYRALVTHITPQNQANIGRMLAARLRQSAAVGAATGSSQPSPPIKLNSLAGLGVAMKPRASNGLAAR